jgi:hypothetical protein
MLIAFKNFIKYLFKTWDKITIKDASMLWKRFDSESVFMNFNYTNILQRIY